jgi:hypothetical protein
VPTLDDAAGAREREGRRSGGAREGRQASEHVRANAGRRSGGARERGTTQRGRERGTAGERTRACQRWTTQRGREREGRQASEHVRANAGRRSGGARERDGRRANVRGARLQRHREGVRLHDEPALLQHAVPERAAHAQPRAGELAQPVDGVLHVARPQPLAVRLRGHGAHAAAGVLRPTRAKPQHHGSERRERGEGGGGSARRGRVCHTLEPTP